MVYIADTAMRVKLVNVVPNTYFQGDDEPEIIHSEHDNCSNNDVASSGSSLITGKGVSDPKTQPKSSSSLQLTGILAFWSYFLLSKLQHLDS